jgi:hypothetical protein
MVSRIREAGQAVHVLNSPHARHLSFRSIDPDIHRKRTRHDPFIESCVARSTTVTCALPGSPSVSSTFHSSFLAGDVDGVCELARAAMAGPDSRARATTFRPGDTARLGGSVDESSPPLGGGWLFTFTPVPDRFFRFVDRVLALKVTPRSAPITARAFFAIFPDERNF